MITNDLGHQRQSKPGAVHLGGDEGIENIWQQIAGHARTIVAHRHFQRQRYAFAGKARAEFDAGAVAGGQGDLAAMAGVARENVSRTLAEWRKSNVVTKDCPYYCIKDLDALAREMEFET